MPSEPAPARLPDDVFRVLGAAPGIERVRLAGSRAAARAVPESDWDFAVETSDFRAARERMPGLVAPLHPVIAQWDRLSNTWCYMLILAGPVKVDLIFAEPHTALPPWQVTAATLPGIDDHFWDWLLWLSAKHAAGKAEQVETELTKLHQHLLAPLGVATRPGTLGGAVASYRSARATWEARLAFQVSRSAEYAVAPALGS
jgi:hypothetical protein